MLILPAWTNLTAPRLKVNPCQRYARADARTRRCYVEILTQNFLSNKAPAMKFVGRQAELVPLGLNGVYSPRIAGAIHLQP